MSKLIDGTPLTPGEKFAALLDALSRATRDEKREFVRGFIEGMSPAQRMEMLRAMPMHCDLCGVEFVHVDDAAGRDVRRCPTCQRRVVSTLKGIGS